MEIKNINNFMDYRGFLVQKKPGGHKYNAVDSNFLNTNWAFQSLLVEDSKQKRVDADLILKTYRTMPGVLRRYWKNDRNVHNNEESVIWTDPRTVSRDNSIGYICLAGYMGHYKSMRSFAWGVLKRGSFFQNTRTTKGKPKLVPDFCGLTQWSTLLRACFKPGVLVALYPVLLFLDVFFMLSLIFDVLRSKFKPNHCSTVFHTVSAIMQKRVTLPTPFSALGGWVYFKFLSKPDGYIMDEHAVISCLRYYSRASYDPPIYNVTKRLIEEWSL